MSEPKRKTLAKGTHNDGAEGERNEKAKTTALHLVPRGAGEMSYKRKKNVLVLKYERKEAAQEGWGLGGGSDSEGQIVGGKEWARGGVLFQFARRKLDKGVRRSDRGGALEKRGGGHPSSTQGERGHSSGSSHFGGPRGGRA